MLCSCHHRPSPHKQSLPSLYPSPQTLPVRLENGYTVNPFTQDSIYPIFTTTGELVVTGKPIPFKGKPKPLAITEVAQQTTINTYRRFPNVFPATSPQVYAVDKTIVKDTTHILTNTLGDTLATGVPLKVPANKKLLGAPSSVQARAPKLGKQALYDINVLGIEQNMASNRVYDLYRSKNNRLWLATYAGISLYNGSSFSHYGRAQGLPNGNVRSIIEDRQGNVWFSPRGEGICKYEGDSLMVLNHQNAILDDYVICITQDLQGNIWWGTNYGLTKYDGQSVTHYTTKEGMPSNVVRAIYVDKQGKIWVGTDKGLASFDNKKIEVYRPQNLDSLSVTTILADNRENIWVGTDKQGLLKYEGAQLTQYTMAQGLSDNAIKTIKTDAQANLWMITQKGNLNKFDQRSFTQYSTKEGLPDGVLMDVLIGENGIVWLATESVGLIRYSPNSFRFPVSKPNTKHVRAKAMASDSKGQVWMVTQDNDLVAFTDSSIMHHSFELFRNNYTVNALMVDRKDQLWLGTNQGIFKYYKGKLESYLSEGYVLSLLEDHQGNIWVGTYGTGLWKYDQKQWLQYTEQEGLASNTIYTMLQDQQHTLWLGTNEGLAKFDGKHLFTYTTREGLSNNVVLSLFEDAKYGLWIGTYAAGLMLFDGKQLTYYTTKEGLPSQLIASITNDTKDNIWISTDKGLACLKSTKKTTNQPQRLAIQPMVHKNLKSIDFEFNSVQRDKAGNLWWGANKALVNYPAKAISTPNAPTPTILIDDIQVNEQSIDYRQLNDSIKTHIRFDSIPLFANYPINPSFSPYLNHLTFRFTHMGLTPAEQVYYTYRIKELNQRWSKPTVDGEANYRNLPNGCFTLQVKACTKSQPWGKTLEYSFRVRAHWWQTWWFTIGLLVLICLLAWTGHQQRMQLIRKQKTGLEKLVADKTQEIEAKNKALVEAKERENKALVEAKERENAVLNQTMKNELQRFFIIKEIFEGKYTELQTLSQQFNKLSRENASPRLRQLSTDLDKLTASFIEGRQIVEAVEVQHPRMLASVKAKYPHLSENEVKHSLLVKLNYAPKEAAQLLGVTHNAVRMARKRLIKKLEIPEGMALHEFLNREKV